MFTRDEIESPSKPVILNPQHEQEEDHIISEDLPIPPTPQTCLEKQENVNPSRNLNIPEKEPILMDELPRTPLLENTAMKRISRSSSRLSATPNNGGYDQTFESITSKRVYNDSSEASRHVSYFNFFQGCTKSKS